MAKRLEELVQTVRFEAPKKEPFDPRDYDYFPPGEAWGNGQTRQDAREPLKPKFPLVAWKDIAFDAEEEWVVEEVFPRIGLACLYGGPGSVRTYILIDLFLRIARGGLWGGRNVMQGPVVYIAAEGANGIKKRIVGMKKVLAEKGLVGDVPFYLITVAPNVGTGEDDRKELIRCIEALGIRPVAIAVDTTAQSIGAADENGPGMAQLVVNATALVNYFGCLVTLVHHVPLSDDERLRGGTSLIGALDVSILSKRAKGSFIATLAVKKMKDGDDGQTFTVHLARIVLGRTKKDREISTLVVESVEPRAAEGAVTDKKLPDSAVNALSALRYALDEVGKIRLLRAISRRMSNVSRSPNGANIRICVPVLCRTKRFVRLPQEERTDKTPSRTLVLRALSGGVNGLAQKNS